MTMQLIHNHYIKSFESGIIQLIINTTKRWLEYDRISNEKYRISNEEQSNILEVELPLKEGVKYIATSMQEKDQIIFYYLPYNLITH